jgi:hypothetical protein
LSSTKRNHEPGEAEAHEIERRRFRIAKTAAELVTYTIQSMDPGRIGRYVKD